MKRLTKLADKYGTDKGNIESAHLYTEFYESFFEKYDSPKILEFGTWMGGSSRMFSDFYDGECEIWTCDILKESEESVKEMGNVHFFHVDISDRKSLLSFFEKVKDIEFDIIIDDASHVWYHQLSLISIFHGLVKKNGIYIIEDIHYSRLFPDKVFSPLYFVNFLDPNPMLTDEENRALIDSIDTVQIYSRKNTSKLMEERFGGRSITAIITFEND